MKRGVYIVVCVLGWWHPGAATASPDSVAKLVEQLLSPKSAIYNKAEQERCSR